MPSAGTTSRSSSRVRSSFASAATMPPGALRSTATPPSLRITGPIGPLNNESLPSHEIRTPDTRAMANVMGKSQLVVCGAAMTTQRSGRGASPVTVCQRHNRSQHRARKSITPAP